MKQMQLYRKDEQEVNAISTMTVTTADEAKALYNVTSNPDNSLGDFIGKTINIRDVYIEKVTLENERTGMEEECPRTIIIDTNGVSYACVSKGVYSALCRMFNIFGMPTWEDGLAVEVTQISRGKDRILSLKMV